MTRWFFTLCLTIAVFFLATVFWAGHAVFVLNNSTMYSEYGPVENLQALVLALSCVAFLAPVVLGKKTEKLVLLSCSLLCFAFLLRELDVKRLDIDRTLKFIGSGVGRNVIMATAFTALLSYAAYHWSYYKRRVVPFLRSRVGMLMIAGGCFLVLGDIFEKSHRIVHYGFFEEIAELCGFCLILVAGLSANAGLALEPEP